LTTAPPRLERLVEGLRARRCERALLIGQSHAAHLLAYQRIWSGPLALIVSAEGELSLLAPVYEVEAARAECPQPTVTGYGEPGFGLDLASLDKLVAVAAESVGRGRVGVASDLPALGDAIAQAAGADAVAIDDLVHDVRLIKDAEELRLIARSYALTLLGADTVEAGAQPGATEIELYGAAQLAAQAAAGAVVEFGADLLVGPRSANVCGPVAVPGRTAAEPGDVVLSDICVRHRGYWGDTARTSVAGVNDDAVAAREEKVYVVTPDGGVELNHAFGGDR
jgi:Xaa-Pro aminopeptidase